MQKGLMTKHSYEKRWERFAAWTWVKIGILSLFVGCCIGVLYTIFNGEWR